MSEVESARFADVVRGPAGNAEILVAYDSLGAVYLMKAYPDMNLQNLPPERMRRELEALPSQSELIDEIEGFLNDPLRIDANSTTGEERWTIGLTQTDWMRIALLAAMSYLLQLLIRQYQYYMRLAGFLDSRADAIVLAQRFEKVAFDKLVVALGPDAYDFKTIKTVIGTGVWDRAMGSKPER